MNLPTFHCFQLITCFQSKNIQKIFGIQFCLNASGIHTFLPSDGHPLLPVAIICALLHHIPKCHDTVWKTRLDSWISDAEEMHHKILSACTEKLGNL